jgi:hypothetical protein
MKMLILCGAALLGLAGAAFAETKPGEKGEEKVDRVSLDDKKRPKPAPAKKEVKEGWIELASPTPAKHGTEFIPVSHAGELATLRIEATRGRVIFERAVVTFSDDTTKAFVRRKGLHAKDPAVVFDLGNKKIKKIVVTTERYTDGDYAIFGAAATGGVATR